MRKLLAEAAGTFALVAVICAAAMMPLGAMETGSRAFVTALGAGISIAAMVYAAGAVSGGHFNPAVTCGLYAAGRFPAASALPYVAAQVAGATLAALVIYIVLSGQIGWSPKGFASNGFAAHSPDGYPAASAFAIEAVFSAILVVVYCRTIHHKTSARLIAPLAIGLTFAVLYYLAMPVTNASLNPARSTATALFAEAWAINQLWMFWLAPLLGGLAGGVADRIINTSRV